MELGIVKKSGAWFTYEGEQLGQGRENAKTFLSENIDMMLEISEKIRQEVGIDEVDIDAEIDITLRRRARRHREMTSCDRGSPGGAPCQVPPGDAARVTRDDCGTDSVGRPAVIQSSLPASYVRTSV